MRAQFPTPLQALQTISECSKATKEESALLVYESISTRVFAALASYSCLTQLQQKSISQSISL